MARNGDTVASRRCRMPEPKPQPVPEYIPLETLILWRGLIPIETLILERVAETEKAAPIS
jgi:hypothetical protein